MNSSNLRSQSKFATVSFVLMLVTLWLTQHGYHGIQGDGQIYAFQAFARLNPALTVDLYLQNTSQDQFTLFSPLYAFCIKLLGLENAARALTLAFTVWLLAAAWSFVRSVTDRDAAWLAIALLLIISGDYGSSGVFRILEPFLTARLPAEALIVTALACHVSGRKRLALLFSTGALFIHPLMALPGLLLVTSLWVPMRVGVIGAIGIVFVALAIAVVASILPADSHVLTVMDIPWLDVVRERSQFLFLQLWSFHDWDVNARSFISLALTAFVVTDVRVRKLCSVAVLVGAAGLAVAFIAGLSGPVAILVQGQAWRWVWIVVFIGAALVPITVLQAWRDANCGPLCTVLLLLGWTLTGIDGTACLSLALFFWLARGQIGPRLAPYLRLVAATFAVAAIIWISTQVAPIVSPLPPSSGGAPSNAALIRSIFALKVPAVLLGVIVWQRIRTSRRTWVPALLSTMLAAFSILVFPAAFEQSRRLAAAADIWEFGDWESVIPSTDTVLVMPPRDVGAFVWFTLGRPNYMTLNQSSGVVFSRATALEIRRRSEVLLPLMDPDWRILTDLRAKSVGSRKSEPTIHPLTHSRLIEVCADPQLGFVVSPENAGFDPLRHKRPGAWKDWNLYDCRQVRSTQSAT